MRLTPHTHAWYDRLAETQQGYFYPWRSTVAPRNGEAAYLDLVRAHLAADKDVLDVGCGHGEVDLAIAPHCRSVLAYDRVASFIDLAQAAQRERGITNVTFVCADSSADANDGQSHIPAAPASFDLLISRRGPLHWLADARRVARPGATLIQLNPMEWAALPSWNSDLPPALRLAPYEGAMRAAVERRLADAGIALHSCWTFDVPEWFDDPREFYVWRTWGEAAEDVPSYAEVAPGLARIFARYAGSHGLAIRHCRLLWQAVIE